ncbi:hypothetical protein Tco_1002226 [Tanacetum coccineum]|uniref:Uncharacterized protein n=1 Tax=Tanacetum coccineum TaxID=301880 RepID=A0ABQ5F5Q7_9ASTR
MCVYFEWAISSLPNGIDSNPDNYPPHHEDPLLIRDALFYPRPLGKTLKHVRVTHPHAFSDDLYLVDHVMIPLSERSVFKIMPSGKRPHLPTPTPSESSESTSSSSRQEEENDLINNFTLDPIPYINQLPPIEGGESSEFKQTKGMFKCLGHFISNPGKKKK